MLRVTFQTIMSAYDDSKTFSSLSGQHKPHTKQRHPQVNMTNEPVEFRDARSVRALMNSQRIDFKVAVASHAFAELDHGSLKIANESMTVRKLTSIPEQVEEELGEVADGIGSTTSRKRKAASMVIILRRRDTMDVF